jgi:hypothetical protein
MLTWTLRTLRLCREMRDLAEQALRAFEENNQSTVDLVKGQMQRLAADLAGELPNDFPPNRIGDLRRHIGYSTDADYREILQLDLPDIENKVENYSVCKVGSDDRPHTPTWLTLAISSVPLIAMIGGAIWTVLSYLDNRAAEEKKTAELQILEAKKPFLDAQLAIYRDLTTTVGKIVSNASLRGSDQWKTDYQHFWDLYFTQLPLVEDPLVRSQLETFSYQLLTYVNGEYTDQNHTLAEKGAHDLAVALRKSISQQWQGGSP